MSILESWYIVRHDKDTGEEEIFPNDADWSLVHITNTDRIKALSTEHHKVFGWELHD